MKSAKSSPPSDRFTLIAISALAYIAATGLHEHFGHTLACYLLGSHPTEIGAFYVNCNETGLSDLSIRLVALAGPAVSLLVGIVCFFILSRKPPRASNTFYFVWLLGSLGLMSATGYLLFSGISGIGDFGTTRDGLFYQAAPEWLWRIILTLVGTAGYLLIVYISVRRIDPRINGSGRTRIHDARLMALTSYLTGAVVSVGIGLLNPHGLMIVAISSAASSLGGSSGLLWMMQWLDRNRQIDGPGLILERSSMWIVAAGVVTIFYAVILGPTLHP